MRTEEMCRTSNMTVTSFPMALMTIASEQGRAGSATLSTELNRRGCDSQIEPATGSTDVHVVQARREAKASDR